MTDNGATIDLNADLGEGEPTDADLLAVVTSCNIACGGHAGDANSMRHTLLAASARGVRCGAHPGYPDRKGFGRRSAFLRPGDVPAAIQAQIAGLMAVAAELDIEIAHVKPHGALYNDAAHDPELARSVSGAVRSLGGDLALVGPPRSQLETAALEDGVEYICEGFVDRAYLADGRLMPRSEPGAVLTGAEAAVKQAVRIARDASVRSADGAVVAVPADTLCIHGDTPDAVVLARAVRAALCEAGVELKPPAVKAR